jgi:hypothetical protein
MKNPVGSLDRVKIGRESKMGCTNDACNHHYVAGRNVSPRELRDEIRHRKLEEVLDSEATLWLLNRKGLANSSACRELTIAMSASLDKRTNSDLNVSFE